MKFIKYPSIENENKISPPTQDIIGIDWVVTEKVHGCNFQLDFNNETKEITACRRKAKLNTDDNFHQFKKIIDKYTVSLTELYNNLDQQSFRVYGEIFGGGYPRKMDETNVLNIEMVQTSIFYCLEIDFIVFDIFTKDRWLDWNNVKDLCYKVGFKVVPELYIGDFSKAIMFDPNDMITKVPDFYKLPVIEGNIMEGVVIRPIKEPASSLIAEWPANHELRQMYKIRTKNYKETKRIKSTKVPKNRDPEIISQLAKVQSYVTKNRFNAIKSKELPIESIKEISKYIDLMVEDIKKDVTSDNIEINEIVYNILKKDIAILIRKEINSLCITQS